MLSRGWPGPPNRAGTSHHSDQAQRCVVLLAEEIAIGLFARSLDAEYVEEAFVGVGG